MKRYKPLFEYSYNKLEEDFHLFSVVKNKKVFVKSFMDMCKHYNKFYKMINPKIMSNGHAVNCRVLLWDNNVANFDFDILDNGQVFIDFAKVPNNVVNFNLRLARNPLLLGGG